MSVFDWSTTASNNGSSDSTINFAEGQAPSTLNDSARALMARVAHWLNMLGANITMGGASNAYTLTSGESLSAYSAGMRFLWSPNADSTGSVTINVDTIGAKKIYMPNGTQAGSGDLDADNLYDIAYDTSLDSSAGGFKIVGFQNTFTSADETKLDGIETGADVTDATNVAAAGALMASNNLSDVANASTARSNIGAYGSGSNVTLGTVSASGDASLNTGSGFGQVIDIFGNRKGLSSAYGLGIEAAGAVAYLSGGVGHRWYSGKQADGSPDMSLSSSGDLTVIADMNAVDFNATSDARLKKDVKPIPYGLNEVLALRPVRHEWKDEYRKGEKALGFIAQELEKIMPELVSTDETGMKSVAYGKGMAVLVRAIQELAEEVRNGRS